MSRRAWVVSLVLLAAAVRCDAKGAAPRTVGDLAGEAVPVSPNPPQGVDLATAMQSYQKFLDLNSGDALLRAEALRRLGDLHLESSTSERIQRELATNEALQAEDAIVLYKALLAKYPDYALADAVLYQLARAYETTNDTDRALATLDRLVARYPASRYIDEAQFRRGEILFSAAHYRQAQRAYEAAIRFGPRSEFYGQSEYKLGWSLFKQNDNEGCLAPFAQVLDGVLVSKRDPGALVDVATLSRPNRELVDDTFRAMSIAFSYVDGPKTIDALLRRMPPRPYAYLLYSHLGDLYMKKQRYTDAADAYRAFVARDPRSEQAPLLQMKAIDAYSRGGFPDLVLKGKREFVDDYSFGTPYWQGREPAEEPKVVAELKKNLQDLAQYYHAAAQKSQAPADFETAAGWYRRYLDAFPHGADAAQTNFLLAETLFESHQYLQAAKEYEHTAYGYGANPKAADAGYAAVVSYDKQAGLSDGVERDQVRRMAVASSLRFAAAFPQHPQAAQVLAHAVTELYREKRYPQAIDAAGRLLARQPSVDASQQKLAWTVIADSQFATGAYDRAEAAYTRVEGLMGANDPQRPAIVDRLAASIYKQGEQKNAAGDANAAVSDFLRVGQLAPTSKIRANADFDAGALLIREKQWDRAIAALEDFRRNFPESPLQEDVTRKLAVAYSNANRPAQAAAEFERISSAAGEPVAVQREATLEAADMYGKAGDVARARSMLETFVKRYPSPLDPAMDARNKLRLLAARDGDHAAETHWLEAIVAADREAGAARTDRSRALAAEATLALAEPLRERFDAIKLTTPLKRSLARKRDAMQAALHAYQQAAGYQVAGVTTAATYRSAQLYQQLAKDLMNSERPKHLSKDDLAEYDVLLEEQAIPFENQAIKLDQINAARTKEGIYDQWVQKSFAALAQLDPARYDKVEIGETQVDSIR
ncbi:MAG: tetratricopeptide repeat protein [Gammaproteobacteria bacterium]|nr:tetratricopeptide repeat protein [Gammaproteobacteria bacterium]